MPISPAYREILTGPPSQPTDLLMKNSSIIILTFGLALGPAPPASTHAQNVKIDQRGGSYGFGRPDQRTTVSKPRGELKRSKPSAFPERMVRGFAAANPECGANALYVLLKALGVQCTRDQLRSKVSITGKGASMLDLQRVASSYGVRADVEQLSPDDVPANCPLILLISQGEADGGHYIVGIGKELDFLQYIDGTTGRQTNLRRGDFERMFTGYALVPRGGRSAIGGRLWYGIIGAETAVLAAVCLLYVARSRSRQDGRALIAPG